MNHEFYLKFEMKIKINKFSFRDIDRLKTRELLTPTPDLRELRLAFRNVGALFGDRLLHIADARGGLRWVVWVCVGASQIEGVSQRGIGRWGDGARKSDEKEEEIIRENENETRERVSERASERVQCKISNTQR